MAQIVDNEKYQSYTRLEVNKCTPVISEYKYRKVHQIISQYSQRNVLQLSQKEGKEKCLSYLIYIHYLRLQAQ